jgi:hypothetical protein
MEKVLFLTLVEDKKTTKPGEKLIFFKKHIEITLRFKTLLFGCNRLESVLNVK